MNITKWVMICLLAPALAPAGCSKKETSNQPQAISMDASNQPQAISIDMARVRDAFATASPELLELTKEAIGAISATNYTAAVPAWDKLAADPGLTDDQKKVVAELSAQVKQMAARVGTRPSQ